MWERKKEHKGLNKNVSKIHLKLGLFTQKYVRIIYNDKRLKGQKYFDLFK